ncbi:MAG: hypothetical protein DRQ98_11350 [Gammaproteobacteria bacterium]|nr:MAG: hypothetical protein DRQ98_11350 [Gammaproteobacteria bacterium]
MIYRDVARQTPISEVDLKIAERVRVLRSSLLISQGGFAEQLNITRARLEKIEGGKIPVHWGIGERICCGFDVNQRWLVEGKFPMQPYIRVDLTDSVRFATIRSTFSEVYFRWVKVAIEEKVMSEIRFRTKLARRATANVDSRKREMELLDGLSRWWLGAVDADQFKEFILGLYGAGLQLISEVGGQAESDPDSNAPSREK